MASETLLPVIFVPMTGEAEEHRQVEPAPRIPPSTTAISRRFRRSPQCPAGTISGKWTSSRPTTRRRASATSPSITPSRAAGPALQAFAINGRYVRQLQISVRAAIATSGRIPRGAMPLVQVQFYDENRATMGDQKLGAPPGNSEWKAEARQMNVPVGPARR